MKNPVVPSTRKLKRNHKRCFIAQLLTESQKSPGGSGGASTSFCDRQRSGGVDYSQKFMKPALLAGAKKQSVAALALLAKAASV